jgi:hypothetical protein
MGLFKIVLQVTKDSRNRKKGSKKGVSGYIYEADEIDKSFQA